MNAAQVQRYNDLYKMIKPGKPILPDRSISPKLSDFKKADYEFRVSGPSCVGALSCSDCQSKKVCWDDR